VEKAWKGEVMHDKYWTSKCVKPHFNHYNTAIDVQQ